jgi:hypothetical protein
MESIENKEQLREKIIEEARRELDRLLMTGGDQKSDYQAFLEALSNGKCPGCKAILRISEAEEGDEGFYYKYECGHAWRGITIRETIEAYETIKLKQKRRGVGGFIKTIVQGYKPSGDPKLSKGVDIQMIVDREKNEYHQIVKDNKTKSVLHEEREPLTKHKSKN